MSLYCCDDFDKAVEEKRVIFLNGIRYLDENIAIANCPWCGRIYGKQTGTKYVKFVN